MTDTSNPAGVGELVLVPREPTEAMIMAANQSYWDTSKDPEGERDWFTTYRAILAAAPVPSHEHPIRDSQGGLSSTGERVATTTDTAELVAQYRTYIAACSGPGTTLYDGHPAVLMSKGVEHLTALERERDEARKKAGKLHDYANMRDWQILDLREALKPFAQEKMPSLKMSEIAYNSFGLRCLMSPMAIARQKAIAALRREGPSAAEAALTAAQAEVERLKEALKPFNALATVVLGEAPADAEFIIVHTDSTGKQWAMRLTELRAVAAALQPQVGK